jgi:hypothetical protein
VCNAIWINFVEVESGRRAKFSYNDWSGSGSRVVNDVRGCTSRPNTRSGPSRDSRSSRLEVCHELVYHRLECMILFNSLIADIHLK